MSLNDAHPMAQRCTSLLGLAVVDLWSHLPRETQEALFEQALRQDGGEGAEGPPMREELAKFLHDRHERTLQKETATA